MDFNGHMDKDTLTDTTKISALFFASKWIY